MSGEIEFHGWLGKKKSAIFLPQVFFFWNSPNLISIKYYIDFSEDLFVLEYMQALMKCCIYDISSRSSLFAKVPVLGLLVFKELITIIEQ